MKQFRCRSCLQLEDAKRLCDDETKERQSLLGRFRNLEHEYDGMNVILEEEVGVGAVTISPECLNKIKWYCF